VGDADGLVDDGGGVGRGKGRLRRGCRLLYCLQVTVVLLSVPSYGCGTVFTKVYGAAVVNV